MAVPTNNGVESHVNAAQTKGKAVNGEKTALTNGDHAVATSGDQTTTTNGDSTSTADGGEVKPAEEATTEEKQTEQTNGTVTTEEPAVDKGSISESRDIYRGAKDDDGQYTWSDKPAADAEAPAENETTARYAVVVRKKKSTDSRKYYEAHSIIIQSPFLREALQEVFKDYPGVTPSLERFIVDAPFQPFVHCWQELAAYMARDNLEPKMKEHLNLLHDILKQEVGEDLKVFEDFIRHGVVEFESMWALFRPGQVNVHVKPGKAFSASELRQSFYENTRCGRRLSLDCRLVDIDGDTETFGWTHESFFIPAFRGTRKITSLKLYPMKFHDNPEELVAMLQARGKKFESLRGYQFKEYDGPAITWDRDDNELVAQVTGRIIVDIKSFNAWSPFEVREVDQFGEADEERFKEAVKTGLLEDLDEETQITATVSTKLTPYHQMLCHSRTRGYSMKSKRWFDFYVDNIREISWNHSAFDRLVLPEDTKDMILACSEAQIESKGGFDDVVKGKGQGMIVLLSGPPGVGKTLTAEAVAENMKVPLHTMTSGDLGSHASDLENELEKVLDMVARWNAILLIDECDVFLEARGERDLERNRVVSIFLRTLEYYQGILFMTTNRSGQIDPAFQSRIHMSLPYPELTKDSRRQIWSNFLQSSNQLEGFSKADLDELSGVDINGRQIKNVLKTAQLLASRKKERLNRTIVDKVLGVENRRPEVTSRERYIYM